MPVGELNLFGKVKLHRILHPDEPPVLMNLATGQWIIP